MTISIIAPPPLKHGDTLGIVAPAGQIADRGRFDQGLRILADMGFQTRFPREMWPGTGYLADTDRNRVTELMKMFADSDIHGVIAARGGYGCLRLLEQMDFNAIRENPKPILGFSDISLLLNQTIQQAGVLCFHGPVVTSLCDCTRTALERLHSCLTGNWRRSIAPRNLEILRSGEPARGRLVGGNLNTLMTTLGTRFDFSWRDCILVLEDVNEPVYRLDRMLTQLGLCGKLMEPAGILLGDFTLNSSQQMLEKMRYTEYIWERVLALTAAAGIPVWGNFPTGHCPENLTLPFGARAVMDSANGELQFS
jgi:muramoyltetrapeptide carboxypeptidase